MSERLGNFTFYKSAKLVNLEFSLSNIQIVNPSLGNKTEFTCKFFSVTTG